MFQASGDFTHNVFLFFVFFPVFFPLFVVVVVSQLWICEVKQSAMLDLTDTLYMITIGSCGR